MCTRVTNGCIAIGSFSIAIIAALAVWYSPPSTAATKTATFQRADVGADLYTQHCSACHGTNGAGARGAFPPLAGDPVVTAANPKRHILTVLHGLHGKSIRGVTYTASMPAFSQLADAAIAAIIDHERRSWGNNAPLISRESVKHAR